MATKSGVESLDEEISELLRNYKFKKATVYEPCTHENFKECLIGLHEEFELLNINYVFNPYCDVVRQTLHPDALVALINSVWTLLHYHKAAVEKATHLEQENHVLEHMNKQLNGLVGNLKEKVNAEKNESKACIASAQRVSDNSDELSQTLTKTKAKLIQLTKQKETLEKNLRYEINRLKLDNQKLTDMLRNKSGSFTPCSDMCDTTILQMKEREKKYQELIAKLQLNGQKLLEEIIAIKEKIILSETNYN